MWQLPVNIRQGVVFASPKSYEERGGVAESCVRKLNIRVPALVDGFDNATEQAYTAWPDRLYVVDMNGRIAYKSSPGPFGFKPRQVEEALSKLLR